MTSAGRVDVLSDPSALADAAAALVADHAGGAIAARGRFVLALSGGSTPRASYQRLAQRSDLDWTRVHVVWGDERGVAPDHVASNYRMAREALLDHVAVPAAQVHRIRGEAPLQIEARRYEAELRAVVPDGAIDLVLLGLGGDGHTASLFPDDPASMNDGRWVRAVSFADARGARITLTDTALVSARTLVFLVAGAGKATAVSAVLGQSEDPSPLPARRVARRGRDVRWLLDREAAAAFLTDLGSATTES